MKKAPGSFIKSPVKATLLLYGVLAAVIAVYALTAGGGGLPDEFPAPEFILSDVFGGDDVSLTALKGRPVMIYFFASW